MQRIDTAALVFVIMAVAVTGLAGYVFPLLLHFALKPFGADHLIIFGFYASGGYAALANAGAPQLSWWQDFAIAAENQINALPLFAVLALPASIGVAVWLAVSRRPASLVMAFGSGALPGAALVALVFMINYGAPPMVGPEPMMQAMAAAQTGFLWSGLVSFSVLVAIAAVVSTIMINTWLHRR